MNKFEYEAEILTEDGEGTEKVTLVFKDINMVPSGIYRKHYNDPDGLLWATFEWALSADQLEVFYRVPMTEVDVIAGQWGKTRADAKSDADKPKTTK